MPIAHLDWNNYSALTLLRDPALTTAWDRLNATRGDVPFMTADAVNAALEILGTGSERLLVGRERGEIVAMFLLAPQGKFRWRTFQPSQLPLGTWVAEAHIPLQELAASLQRGPLGFCLVLSITQVDPRLAARQDDSLVAQTSDYIETGWIDVSGSYEDYWNARGKNLRQNMRKQRNKLGTEGITPQLRTWTLAKDMAPALERYGLLESAGWKAARGTAIHLENDQGRFYRKLLETAASREEALVYEYLFDDRTVAVNLCVNRGGTLVILKTTYDESIQTYSPAFLLSQDALETLFQEGKTQKLEYYGRLMEWHTKWTENKRTLYHLTMFRWPFLKQVAQTRRRQAEVKVVEVKTAEAI